MFSFNRLSNNFRRMLGINNRRGYNVRCLYKILKDEEIESFVNNESNVILDVREEDEFEGMHIKNAINIPVNKLDSSIYNTILTKNTNILVYCSTGDRTNYAVQRLTNLGYTSIYIFGNGGINTLTNKKIIEYK